MMTDTDRQVVIEHLRGIAELVNCEVVERDPGVFACPGCDVPIYENGKYYEARTHAPHTCSDADVDAKEDRRWANA